MNTMYQEINTLYLSYIFDNIEVRKLKKIRLIILLSIPTRKIHNSVRLGFKIYFRIILR